MGVFWRLAGRAGQYAQVMGFEPKTRPEKTILANGRHFALDFAPEQSMHGATDVEPDRLCSSPPPAPLGLRGVWVVAARCCAGLIERSFTMSKSKRARSTNTRAVAEVRAKP